MARLTLPIRIAIALIAITAVGFAIESWRLGFWDDNGPGPGLLPFVTVAILLPLLALLWREPATDEEKFRFNPLGAVVLMAIYAAVLPHLGFLIPTVALIVLWVRFFHGESWLRALLLSIPLVAAGTFLFVGLLKVPMQLMPM